MCSSDLESEKLSEVSAETDETNVSEVDNEDNSEINNDADSENITEIEADQSN